MLTDTIKQQWVLGKPIGVGGFGELYVASFRNPDGKLSPEKFVVKVEPHSNGPLFVEVHFYLRGTKQEEIEKKVELAEEVKVDWMEEVEKRMMSAGSLFHCSECKFNNKEESKLVEHVQSNHLPGFPGYRCPVVKCQVDIS